MAEAQMFTEAGIQRLYKRLEIQNNQTDNRRRYHKPAPSLLPSRGGR